MTVEEQNKFLMEANRFADEAITSAKNALAAVDSMEILDEETMGTYFEKKKTQFFSPKFEKKMKP